MTKLAVPIAAPNIESAKEQIRLAVEAGAEMVELRMDYLENTSVEAAKELVAEVRSLPKKIQTIVTCRDQNEGGAQFLPTDTRIDILVAGMMAGAEFADFELNNYLVPEYRGKIRRAVSASMKGKLILSTHNFDGKFPSILQLHRKVTTLYPAAVSKIVYTAHHIVDCFDAFDFLHSTSGNRIVFCMGEAGLISRVLAKKFGSMVSFASLNKESATAPGQVTIEEMMNVYRWDSINKDTELYGVIGCPVSHSMSPTMHNASFEAEKLNKLYLPLLIDDEKAGFYEFMRFVIQRKWLGFKGFSVTLPHKENAFIYAKEKQGFIESLADRIGACNTITLSNEGKVKTYNTDYIGAMDAIVDGMEISKEQLDGVKAAVIGAGGVARAVVAGLVGAGAKVKIYNRTTEKAVRLAAEFGCEWGSLEELDKIDAKLLVNCTSIGMSPSVNETPIPKGIIKKDMAVFDTIYNPPQTLLLKNAQVAGATTIDGVQMFVRQAAEQFRMFTSQKPDLEVMKKAVLERLARN
jgi:3-dehydroquinate dehydratase/shikimate dehydrogenase